MGALAHSDPLPEQLRAEIARLHSRGFSLLPLGGKTPLVKDWASERLSLAQVFGPMNRLPSLAFGIRLGGHTVVDLDEDDDRLVSDLEQRFGEAQVHVKTPRGRHLYYASPTVIRLNLRSEGMPVDIKSGSSSYVVGPGSVRPDGGEYAAVKGQLGQALTVFSHAVQRAKPVAEGYRHNELISQAIRMVEFVDGPDELAENLKFFRDASFHRPGDCSDVEVEDAASWAWSKRLSNSIYCGRNSAFNVSRPALDCLKGRDNATDSIALYTVLTDLHGHTANKPFALVWNAMRDAGHTDLAEKRFRRAKNSLLDLGLLVKCGNHRAGNQHQRFRLTRHPRSLAPTDRGEALNLIYVGQKRPGTSKVGQYD